jgi:hypothetical protein
MADIFLGPAGSPVTLPQICWPVDSPPKVEVSVDKNVDQVTMLDGSTRFNIKGKHPASWPLAWDGIEAAALATLLGVVVLNQVLVYKNEYTDNVDHNVVVTGYSWALKAGTAPFTAKYTFSMTLAEVV